MRSTALLRRSVAASKLLTAMAIFICLGIAAYMVLTLLVNRQTPATPDTHYTGTNGISVYYDSSVWSVCRMTEDATLGTVLELATADTADSEDYQAVLLQRGTADSYESFIEDSEADLKQAYGVIKPRKVNLTVEGAAVEAVRCDIQHLLRRAGHHHLRQRRCGLCLGADKAGVHQRCGQSGRKREPVMSDLRAMQRLCGLMRKAVQDYEMIAPGDRVMVGVSGGKDSVALTIGLSMLRKYIGFDYEVVAVTLDPQFDHQPMDYSALAELFRQHGIPYEVRRTEIGPVVFEYRKEKNPCALCAKLRRGALHTAAQELGCNKVALGHHLDDAVETFYMNLWREGRIGCFSPVTYLSQRDLTLIRPMLLATEYEVQCAVREADLPIVKSRCPADGVTVREQTKEFVQERCRTDHAFRQKTLHALQESGIDGWRPVHTGRGSFIVPKKETDHAETTV